jgi:hypothetical protein
MCEPSELLVTPHIAAVRALKMALSWSLFRWPRGRKPKLVILARRTRYILDYFTKRIRDLEPCIHYEKYPCDSCRISLSKKVELEAVQKEAAEEMFTEIKTWGEYIGSCRRRNCTSDR